VCAVGKATGETWIIAFLCGISDVHTYGRASLPRRERQLQGGWEGCPGGIVCLGIGWHGRSERCASCADCQQLFGMSPAWRGRRIMLCRRST
jgi:hypothetical protein